MIHVCLKLAVGRFLLDIPSSPQNVWINNVEFEPRIHWTAPKHPGGLPLSYVVKEPLLCKNDTRSDNPHCSLCQKHLILGTDVNMFMCTLNGFSPLEGIVYEAIVEVKNALGFNTSSPVEFKANKYEIFLSEYTYNRLLNIISNIIYIYVPRYFVALLGRDLPTGDSHELDSLNCNSLAGWSPTPTNVIMHSKYFFFSDWRKSWPAYVDIK